MILICRECDTPHVIPAANLWACAPGGLSVCCPCGAIYRLTVEQVQRPSPAKQEQIARERRGRIECTKPKELKEGA